jgi:succinate dehydrogenase flavin-adding protein (antitoxin of CptAB toxin-antitoxin module)
MSSHMGTLMMLTFLNQPPLNQDLDLVIINLLQPDLEAMNEGQANELIQYLLQGDNEVFMMNPQEEDGLQADGHEHNEHIEQLNQLNPAPFL